jgi:hypothetical protein
VRQLRKSLEKELWNRCYSHFEELVSARTGRKKVKSWDVKRQIRQCSSSMLRTILNHSTGESDVDEDELPQPGRS